jgi:predicted site-specific integrase-resolvase
MTATSIGRCLSRRQIAERLGVSVSTHKAWERKGTWPPPLRFSRGKRLWPESVVEAALRGEWKPKTTSEDRGPKK